MAPSSSQPSGSGHAPSRNICRYFPGGEHKRTTDFSPRQSKRPILRPTPTGSRSRRGATLPCPVSYFVSFPGAASPAPYPRLPPIQLHPFPLSPRRHGARASRFSILADGTCRAEGSVPPSLLTPPSAILCRVSADETTRARQTRKFETLFTDLIEEERHVP